MTQTAIEQKFKPGDRVLQDLNSPEWPESERQSMLIEHGTVIDYRRMRASGDTLYPYVRWDNNQEGYASEEILQPSDKAPLEDSVDDSKGKIIDVTAEEISPGLERLKQLETEIEQSRLQLHRAVAEIYTDNLWQEAGYDSFVSYCHQRWGWEKSNSYAMASAGEAIAGLLDSGIPESEIPESTSALNELSKAGSPGQQAEILQETHQREGSITAASVKRTLKGIPSVELMIALWSQLGEVKQHAKASHPEQLTVSGELFEQPLVFATVKEAQQQWEQDAQRLAAIAQNRGIEPNAEAKRTLLNVPCMIVSSDRKGELNQRGELMGDWSSGVRDAAGTQPTPWDYPVSLPGSPILRNVRLYQVKVLWQDTYDWRPQAYRPAHPAAPTTTAAPATEYQPREVSPLYKSDDVRGQQKAAIAQQLENLEPLSAEERYSLIVADPPWRYSLREHDATHRGRTPYPTMDEEALLTLPVSDIAADDAYLLLWTTNAHMATAHDCAQVWGFEVKNIHTWVKMSANTGNPQIGTGHYGRNCTEHYLVCKRGNPGAWTTLGLTDIPSVLFASRKEHSCKPPEFWTIANALRSKLSGKAIELFARQPRPKWDRWGLEA